MCQVDERIGSLGRERQCNVRSVRSMTHPDFVDICSREDEVMCCQVKRSFVPLSRLVEKDVVDLWMRHQEDSSIGCVQPKTYFRDTYGVHAKGGVGHGGM